LVQKLKDETNHLAATMPSNANNYARNIRSYGDFNADSFEVNQLDQIFGKHKFQPQIAEKFKAIVFAKAVVFQTFCLSIAGVTASLNEFIGAARNVNGKVDIAFINVNSLADLVQQYNSVKERKCKKILFWKKCHDEWKNVPRGLTPSEINIVTTALRANAYQHLTNKVNTASNIPMASNSLDDFELFKLTFVPPLFPLAPMAGESCNTMVKDLIKKEIDKVPELKKEINESVYTKTSVINRIVSNGFTSFIQRANIMQLDGVSVDMIDSFVDYLQGQIALPNSIKPHFKNTMKDILYCDSNEWVMFKLVFSVGTGGDCKYVCVLAQHDEKKREINWLIADVQSLFLLAPDVIVINQSRSFLGGLFSKSEDKVVILPKTLVNEQIVVLSKFFEVVVFERFAEILKINSNVPRAIPMFTSTPAIEEVTSLEAPSLTLKFLSDGKEGDNKEKEKTDDKSTDKDKEGEKKEESGFSLSKLISGITSTTNIWEGITKSFKTSKSSVVKEKINGVGFEKFEQSAQFQKTFGLKAQYLDKYLDHLNQRLNVPDKNKKDLKMVVEEIQWADDNQWQCFNVVFSTGVGGNVKMAAVIVHHDEKNDKYDFVVSDVAATFQLADDILIVTKSLSVAGGIFENKEDKITRVPKNITPEDIKSVLDFFTVVSIKNIAENLGIKVDDPFKK